ncbi:hypothetical protein DH2020_041990 [Rehmannia glutinosa]|uniref:Nucleobase-ascorbate transporter 2 n=1 Tax=Rehmannia glutinosa TaxID=99300 RepID=A0ABR0UNG7_REHGL
MAAAPKPEEISHPPMDQLQGLEYCIDSNPSWGEAIALGFQHYILALGTAVMIPSFLVPLMGGNDRFLNTMRAIQGALIVASSVQIILGYSQLWAICSRFFSPLGMVPVISLVGFGLLDRGFPVYLKHFQTKQIPVLERFALLISVTVIWAYAHLLTASGAYKHRPELTQRNCRTDKANLISSAPWIKIPYPLQWGAPTFDAGHAFGMMSAVLVSLIESTGAYKAASRLASATPPPAHVLSRGIGWQGNSEHYLHQYLSQYLQLFIALCSVLLVRILLLFVIYAFSFLVCLFPLFDCLSLFPASVGLSFLQFTNMNSMRNLFITGVSLFLGLSIPEYFREYTSASLHGPAHTRAGWFNDFLNTIFMSSPTVALIVAVFLDNTLDYKDSARDRGMPWWVKFRTFKGDSRNEEFYTLPFNLNRFFPPS